MTSSDPKGSPKMDPTAESIAQAPLPTKRTLRARKSIPRQLVRFAVFNVRMLKMVAKAHH
jgi:hypothetical protein